jgi:protein-disulfide isomerase
MRRFLPFGFLLIAACSRPAPQKPLSAVLEQERIAVPKGSSGDAPLEVRVTAAPVSSSDYDGIPVGITPEGRPYLGSDFPQFEIHMFSDLQCPYCARAHFQLVEWVRRHPLDLRLVYYHFPLTMHQHASDYARQAVCADKQGRFWPMLADLYRSGYHPMNLRKLAMQHQMQVPEFLHCVASRASQQTVDRDIAEGKRLNVQGTPTFFVDGASMNLIDLENLLRAKLKN